MKKWAIQVSNMNTRGWDTVELAATYDEAKRKAKLWAPTYTRIIKVMK